MATLGDLGLAMVAARHLTSGGLDMPMPESLDQQRAARAFRLARTPQDMIGDEQMLCSITAPPHQPAPAALASGGAVADPATHEGRVAPQNAPAVPANLDQVLNGGGAPVPANLGEILGGNTPAAPPAPSGPVPQNLDQILSMPAPQPSAPKDAGLVANIGAGTSESVAQTLGLPVDVTAAGLNLGIAGINQLLGTKVPEIANPVGGAHWWENVEGLVGADPRNVAAATPQERIARAAAAGATSMALPGGVARALPEAAGTAEALRQALAAGAGPGGAASGAVMGAAGQAASAAVPQPYQPVANLAGQIAGGVLGAGITTVGGAAARAGLDQASRIASEAGFARKMPVIDPATGEALLDQSGRPIMTTQGRVRLAGQRIAQGAQAPGILATAPLLPSPVEGFEPTLGQASGDLGVLNLERELRNRSRDLFTARDTANTVALNKSLGALGPEDAADAAGNYVKKLLDLNEAADHAEGARLGEAARTATEGLAGNPTTTGQQALGSVARERLEAIRGPIKAQAGQLLDAVDPDGTLALDASGVGDTAARLLGRSDNPSPFTINPRAGEALAPAEGPVLDAAARMQGVVSFGDLRGLLGEISRAQRQIRADPGLGVESRPFARMQQLRDTVQGAMEQGAADQAREHAVMRQAAPAAAAQAGAPTIGGRVFTPSGREVGVRYELADAGDLVTSHDNELRPNPEFPAELQPRNRAAAASRQQVRHMAANLQPERLGASASAAEGAPIVGPGGVVESGNGRVLAIRRALQEGGEPAQRYRDFLRASGFDPDAYREPVLVRRRVTELSPEERVRFAREANASPVLSMGATERAMTDAQRLPPGVLDLWHGGDIGAAANRDFVRAFARTVPEEGEEGALMTPEGGLSLEGEGRIRNALLARAYGSRQLVEALAERGDESTGAMGNALVDAAGSMARLRSSIERGDVDPEMDLTQPLLDAASALSQARTRRIPLRDWVAQQDMFSGGIGDRGQEILRSVFGEDLAGRGNRATLAKTLEAYARLAQEQTTGPRLFGTNLTPAEVFREAQNAAKKFAPPRAPRSQIGLDLGPGAPGGGAGNRPIAPGAGGEAVGGGGARSATALALEPELAPNFDAEAADRLRLANRAYAEYKSRFRTGPVGRVLASGNTPEVYRLGDAQAVAALFGPGARGGEAVSSLIRAAGSPQEAERVLGDYPAYSLRKAAEKNGALDPKAFDRWAASHKEALDQLPGLRQRFDTAADASRALADAARRSMATRRALEDSALRHYVGASPQTAIERLFRAPNPATDAVQLVRMMKTDPSGAALRGLRHDAAEWLLSRVRATAEAGTSGEREIAKAQFQRLFANPKSRGALRVIFGEQGMERLEGISDALDLAARAHNAVRIKGSPGTAADLNALAKHGAFSLLSQIGLGEVLGGVVGEEAGAHILSHAVGSVFGGGVGTLAGIVAGHILRAMRANGVENINELATLGVLHPELGKVLLSKAVISPRSPLLQTLARRLALVTANAAGSTYRRQSGY